MLYLETEDLLESDPTVSNDTEYVAPKEKLSFDKNDSKTSSNSVIDLNEDIIDADDDEDQTPAAPVTNEDNQYLPFPFHDISYYSFS